MRYWLLICIALGLTFLFSLALDHCGVMILQYRQAAFPRLLCGVLKLFVDVGDRLGFVLTNERRDMLR